MTLKFGAAFFLFTLILSSAFAGTTRRDGLGQNFSVQDSLKNITDGLSLYRQQIGNSPEAGKLRNSISQLVFKISKYSGYTPAQFGNATNAQSVSSAIASVIQRFSNSVVTTATTEAQAIKASLPPNLTYSEIQAIPGQPPASMWDVMIYPQVLVHMIRLQAAYASAILQMMNQNVSYFSLTEIDSLNNTVSGALSEMGALPV